ncbi:MAG: hypothetical protein H0W74_13495 [Sphingosinicella sp.]|nr:hypothetical protein [Sphingosinicella sp.]
MLTLIRTVRSADGVFGVLRGPGFVLCTAEEEDRDNARCVSCIPAGTYPVRRTSYFKHDFPTYEVRDVPGRGRILFHPGNTEEDTQGCILLGLRPGLLRVRDEDTGIIVEKPGVLESRLAFAEFMKGMGGVYETTITIQWDVK